MVNIEDFAKLDLKVAKVLEAERIEKSDKLVKLQVSIGEEKRQIIAGIGASYDPEDLIGKQIIVITNLEPRELFDEVSQGMLLAVKDENNMPVLLIPEKEVPEGGKVS